MRQVVWTGRKDTQFASLDVGVDKYILGFHVEVANVAVMHEVHRSANGNKS